MFAPDNVSVPAPVLISEVPLVPIAPLMVDVPIDSTVSAWPPVTAPDKVSVDPSSIWTSEAPVRVRLPLHTLVPETFLMTPPEETPVPTMLTFSVMPSRFPDTLMAVPVATEVEDLDAPSSPRAVT